MERATADIISKMRALGKPGYRHKYECELCKDTGFIIGPNGAKQCTCVTKKIMLTRMAKAGLEAGNMTFDNYLVDSQVTKVLYKTAKDFIKDFPNGSLAFMGQVGAGKTHIAVAVAHELIEQGKDVYYASYMTVISRLRQSRFNQAEYDSIMNKLTNSGLLLLDDLFKGATSADAKEIIFDVINQRYLNKRPIILTTELLPEELVKVDEAIGSRLIEMTEKYRVVLNRNPKNNRRLKNYV